MDAMEGDSSVGQTWDRGLVFHVQHMPGSRSHHLGEGQVD